MSEYKTYYILPKPIVINDTARISWWTSDDLSLSQLMDKIISNGGYFVGGNIDVAFKVEYVFSKQELDEFIANQNKKEN